MWERQDERIWSAVQPGRGTGGQPTPGPSEPTTPVLPQKALEAETEDIQGEGEGEDDVDEFVGDEDVGEGWGEDADAELDAFLGGSSDWGSEAGDR